jgi:hypothetical protein
MRYFLSNDGVVLNESSTERECLQVVPLFFIETVIVYLQFGKSEFDFTALENATV